jgi:hypothetical protein
MYMENVLLRIHFVISSLSTIYNNMCCSLCVRTPFVSRRVRVFSLLYRIYPVHQVHKVETSFLHNAITKKK